MAETLIKGGDIHGMHIAGIDGNKLGTVREVFLELSSGQLAFVIIEAVGLLGGSGKFHPVPWSAVRFDAIARQFQVEMSKNDFKASPSYDREQLSNRGHGWDEQAVRYFSSAPPPPPPAS